MKVADASYITRTFNNLSVKFSSDLGTEERIARVSDYQLCVNYRDYDDRERTRSILLLPGDPA